MDATDNRQSANVAWGAALSLAWREIVRFFRQRNRVIGAFAQPLLFWGLFSVGLQRSFRVGQQDFGDYFVPGTLMLMILFTAIFATISIIEDRREGFLQGVLVSPVPRWAIVAGKVLGGATVAILQGLLMLLLAACWGVRPGLGEWLAIFALMVVAALGLTSLGFGIAWRMESTQGFHAIMNLLLMPMWLLSGAFFPLPAWDERSGWAEQLLHVVMRANPVTYLVAGVRQLMYGPQLVDVAREAGFWAPSLVVCWGVSLIFLVVIFAWACRTASQRNSWGGGV